MTKLKKNRPITEPFSTVSFQTKVKKANPRKKICLY